MVGNYVFDPGFKEPNSASIRIKPDSSYEFVVWSDVVGKFTAHGIWKVNKDTLFLIQPKKEYRKDLTTQFLRTDSVTFARLFLLDKKDSVSIKPAFVYFNDSKQPANFNGRFYQSAFTSISVIEIMYGTMKVRVDSPDNNMNEAVIYWNFDGKPDYGINHTEKWLIKRKNIMGIGSNEKFHLQY
jgi:hypothetical protein